MNYQQAPQSLPDPTLLLSEGHVFQGQPASQTTSSIPTASGAKKGYGNTLPTADTRKTENSLPTAVSKGSASFATGTPSSLSQPTAQSTPYHGFLIPVKPTPPGAEDCCMSGCAHCIYDIYEEDRQEYKQKLAKVLEEIEKAGLPPPPNVSTGSDGSNSADGNKSNEDDSDMDPSMKAFLELERKLKGS
ncbi:MAG: oxidoreductase-like protein [Benniella sp.]|nr:MAG: oxidoreductase-like protein [Benniella sp.]